MQQILEEIFSAIKNHELKGSVATYIPELAKIDPNKNQLSKIRLSRSSGARAEK